MSEEYHLVCHTCQNAIWVGTVNSSGWHFFYGEEKCMKALHKFTEKHSAASLDDKEHKLEILRECWYLLFDETEDGIFDPSLHYLETTW